MAKLDFTHSGLCPSDIYLTSLSPILVKISGFGIAKHKPPPTRYTAPDICLLYNENPVYTPAADMWSLGIIAYELLTKQTPWEDEYMTAQYVTNSKKIVFPMSRITANRVSKFGTEFVMGCLVTERRERLTVERALKTAWFEGWSWMEGRVCRWRNWGRI
jgi:serine/threonine protein kinase